MIRDRGSMVQDTVRGNIEGVRFVPPPELRAGFDAYSNSLSRSKALNPPARRPAASGAGAGSQ